MVFESEEQKASDINSFKNIEITVQFNNLFREHDVSALNLDKLILIKGAETGGVEELGRHYLGLLNNKATQNAFGSITLAGWLVLALINKGMIVPSNKNQTDKAKNVPNCFSLFQIVLYKNSKV